MQEFELMRWIKHKLKGNSILEILIALAIISFCLSLATLIHLNIQKSTNTFFKLKGVELAEACLKTTLSEHRFFEETYLLDQFTIKKTLMPHPFYTDCSVIRLIVFDRLKNKINTLESVVYTNK